jgi:katanin p60 ATPase-containing subunit A1
MIKVPNGLYVVRPGPVTNEDFEQAIVQVKPSPSLFEKEYLKWEKESGSS